MMSTSEPKPKPERTNLEATGCGCLRRLSSRFGLVALILGAAVAGGVVLLAGLTSWWVLFALMPLALLGACLAMMTAMPRRPEWPVPRWPVPVVARR
jgi:hypothetical protein